jgi:signal transduction histidine kinase/streptogramin lyase
MRIPLIIYKFLLCGLLVPLWCTAVQPYTPVIADSILEPWRWRQEESLEGLGALCMTEAEDGTLWFGNVGSIARYDGTEVEKIVFDDALLSKITHSSKITRAKALTVLPDGNLLVLIGNSLVLRSGDEWNVIIQDVGLSVFRAGLERAADGTIWLIVPGSLWRISEDLTDVSRVMKASENGFLGSFCLDSAGNVWVVEKTGQSHSRLVQIPLKNDRSVGAPEWHEYPVPFETDAVEIWISAGHDDRIWYADDSENTSLAAFDPERSEWSFCDPSHKERFFSLYTGCDGTLWAGGEEIIFRVPPEGEPILYHGDQLQQPQVPLSMFEAANNRLWVIGRIGYVHSVDIGYSQWMTYEQLHYTCETADGIQWFRSKQMDSVVSHDPRSGAWLQYDQSDGLIDTVFAIAASSHGLVWAVGSHEGRAAIAVFDGKDWRHFLHPEFAEWIEPKAIMEAADGTMWFGAGGLRLLDVPQAGGALQYGVDANKNVRLIMHHAPPDIPYYITSFTQAPDQTIWLGSTLIHRYTNAAPAIREPADFQGLNTVDMVFDQNQTLWLAKEHAGVYQQKQDSWKLFSTTEGLAGVSLSDLLVLQDGTLLASSGSGISRFDGKTWTTHAFPQWWTMSRRWSGMHQSADGSVWFNFEEKEAQNAQLTLNQTERFRTIRYRAEALSPDTRIGGYLERVAQPGNSHITWSAHDPWSGTPHEDLQYSWRLNGSEWSAFSHETSRTFLNLPSGPHTLEVRARDRDFNIDPTPYRIEFMVIPPIWKQAWFLVMIFIFCGLVLLLTWLLILNRERHFKEQQMEREQGLLERQSHLREMDRVKTGFFANISHELNTPLTLILEPLKRVLTTETNEKNRERISMAIRNASRVVNLAGQLLDFRKLEQGKIKMEPVENDLVPCLRDTVELLQPLAQMHQVSLRLEGVGEFRGWFDPDKLNKIVQNLAGNAIKFTPAGGEVRLILEICADEGEGRAVSLVVEDTGIGIQPEHLQHIFERFYRVPEKSIVDGSGIGLNLAKDLVELWGGTIKVESPIHPDEERPGTRFTVVLPIDLKDSPESGDAHE